MENIPWLESLLGIADGEAVDDDCSKYLVLLTNIGWRWSYFCWIVVVTTFYS